MSKAFTRESDEVPAWPEPPRRVAVLPPGQKNYLTPAGARQMREALERLVEVERPRLAAATDDDAKRRLAALDQRIRQLHEALQSAEVVGPPPPPWNEVRFGATVTVRDRRGEASRYCIVGIDEADADRDRVSWLSPIARALLNDRLGQRIRFRFPAGEEELEITAITYE